MSNMSHKREQSSTCNMISSENHQSWISTQWYSWIEHVNNSNNNNSIINMTDNIYININLGSKFPRRKKIHMNQQQMHICDIDTYIFFNLNDQIVVFLYIICYQTVTKIIIINYKLIWVRCVTWLTLLDAQLRACLRDVLHMVTPVSDFTCISWLTFRRTLTQAPISVRLWWCHSLQLVTPRIPDVQDWLIKQEVSLPGTS